MLGCWVEVAAPTEPEGEAREGNDKTGGFGSDTLGRGGGGGMEGIEMIGGDGNVGFGTGGSEGIGGIETGGGAGNDGRGTMEVPPCRFSFAGSPFTPIDTSNDHAKGGPRYER